MRVSIHTLGTRGDVQPYLALALGLQGQGHEVRLAGPEQFASFVAQRGVAFTPLPGEFLALLDSPEGKAAVAGGQGIRAGLKLLKHIGPLMRRLLDHEWAAAQGFGPDILVHHPKSLAAPHIAERLRIPAVLASPLPGFTPTAAFPSPLLPVASLGPFNRASHQLAIKGGAVLFGRTLADWRRRSLGLKGLRARLPSQPVLYAYSRHVLPVPQDWGKNVLVSGYWFLDDPGDWRPSQALARFLASGDKPIYVGFGSMPGLDPDHLARLVVEALARAGKRGLLATGGGALALSDMPAHVHVVPGAPHDRLFPHVAAALHHGGAGTTGASLRAGLPTIICPFFGDQPFWGRRVAALGAGPVPLDRRCLTVEALAAAFRATDDPAMRRRAGGIAAGIAQEDGVAAAVTFLERHASVEHHS
jgi:UDP:flavonoid glycosyltransferase YjiC (YdhE family)